MGSWSDRKHGAASGFLAMVLLLVGNFITWKPPRFGAGPVTVLHFYSHHHRAILIGMILTGIAIPLYVWFIAHLATTVGGHLGAAIALGGILVAACAAV